MRVKRLLIDRVYYLINRHKELCNINKLSTQRNTAKTMKPFQELDQLLHDEPVSVIITITVFLVSQLCLGLMSIGILNSAEVIAFFYAANFILMIQAVDFCFRLKRRPQVKKVQPRWRILPVKKNIPDSSKAANMFIERWKKDHVERPQFPLERLAYLNAVHHVCNNKHFFFLRNSQIKLLARKEVHYKRDSVDECHPAKMITDMFAAYVHRRALFFRSRNVVDVNRRQYTQVVYPKSILENDSKDQYHFNMLYARENSRRLRDMAEAFDDHFGTEVVEDHALPPKKRHATFFSRVASAASSVVRPKKESKKNKKHHHHRREHHSGRIEDNIRFSRTSKS